MNKRDEIAAKILPECYKQYCDYSNVNGWQEDFKIGICIESVDIADTLIEVLENKPLKDF